MPNPTLPLANQQQKAKVYGPRLSLAPMAAYARDPGQSAAHQLNASASNAAASGSGASSYTVPDFTSVEFSQFSTVR